MIDTNDTEIASLAAVPTMTIKRRRLQAALERSEDGTNYDSPGSDHVEYKKVGRFIDEESGE